MISGIAITLGDDESCDSHTNQALATMPGLTLGDRAGRRLAAVLDVPSSEAADDAWSCIQAIPGVAFIDCICVLDLHGPDPSANTGEP